MTSSWPNIMPTLGQCLVFRRIAQFGCGVSIWRNRARIVRLDVWHRGCAWSKLFKSLGSAYKLQTSYSPRSRDARSVDSRRNYNIFSVETMEVVGVAVCDNMHIPVESNWSLLHTVHNIFRISGFLLSRYCHTCKATGKISLTQSLSCI